MNTNSFRRIAAGATLTIAPLQQIQQSYGPHASMSHHQKRGYAY